jgi:hypothetical protein
MICLDTVYMAKLDEVHVCLLEDEHDVHSDGENSWQWC